MLSVTRRTSGHVVTVDSSNGTDEFPSIYGVPVMNQHEGQGHCRGQNAGALTRKRETVGPASRIQAVDEHHLAGQEHRCAGHVTMTRVPSKHNTGVQGMSP